MVTLWTGKGSRVVELPNATVAQDYHQVRAVQTGVLAGLTVADKLGHNVARDGFADDWVQTESGLVAIEQHGQTRDATDLEKLGLACVA